MSTHRQTPIEIEKQEFRKTGYRLIDTISDLFETMHERPVTRGESPSEILDLLSDKPLPESGSEPSGIVEGAARLLIEHSLFNGHPKFMGYVTSSPTPIGALADLLAAAVNANAGANILSPVATAIEKQAIGWLAEFLGLPHGWEGIFVSGGNMANFTGFLAARTAKSGEGLKENGLPGADNEMTIYCPEATHTWIEKAATLFGHGTNAIRWIAVDAHNRMNTGILEKTIRDDLKTGKKPFIVIGNAGDVSTGAVDDLSAIAKICTTHDLWFHIDGAYGIPAAAVPEMRDLFAGITEADSIAVDPHKWLYAPLEAGCTLVKDPQYLVNTFSSHPDYYNFGNDEEQSVNFYEFGMQNSRGFRALKVWMALRQAGRSGYRKMIGEDIALSRYLFHLAEKHPELEAVTHNLSITTFRYVPSGLSLEDEAREDYLNTLNEELLNELQQAGEVFLSNAVVKGKYCLRSCIVNFRTSEKDIDEIMEIVVREGRKVEKHLV